MESTRTTRPKPIKVEGRRYHCASGEHGNDLPKLPHGYCYNDCRFLDRKLMRRNVFVNYGASGSPSDYCAAQLEYNNGEWRGCAIATADGRENCCYTEDVFEQYAEPIPTEQLYERILVFITKWRLGVSEEG